MEDPLAQVAVRATMLLATVAWAGAEVLTSRRIATASAVPLSLDVRRARRLWTMGVSLALVHASLALHFVYGWDHEEAVLATASQAEALFGTSWRGSIYVNYAFLLAWAADTAWWWCWPQSRATRPRWCEEARWGLFVFMFANGAVIFAAGIGRLVGIVSVAAVVVGRAGAWRAGRRRAEESQ